MISWKKIFYFAALVNQDDSVTDDFVKNIDKLLPTLLFVKPGTPGLDQLISIVKDKFFRNLGDRKQLLDKLEDVSQ